MSGKVPSRVRITRTQSNTPKFAGKAVPKFALVNCNFGRNKVICQYLKRRADTAREPPLGFGYPVGSATGGAVTYYVDGSGQRWAVHTFIHGLGAANFNVLAGMDVNYLIVAGGGGGGGANPDTGTGAADELCAAGGGGGSGEIKYSLTPFFVNNLTNVVVVGVGGTKGTATQYPQDIPPGLEHDSAFCTNGGSVSNGGDGNVSSVFGIVAAGGLGGIQGLGNDVQYGAGGASGGGAGGGAGTSVAVNQGSGGGGGGSSGAGAQCANWMTAPGGEGGAGTSSSITGVPVVYGVGGGGGCARSTENGVATPAKGGNGVTGEGMGGASQNNESYTGNNEAPTIGVRGGGGGGASALPPNWNPDPPIYGEYPGGGPNNAAAGGDGIVIISYKVQNY